MRILFTAPYPDPYTPGRIYQPGWVAEFTDADGQRAIDAGAATLAPEGAFSRKGDAPSFDCVAPLDGPIAPTGESLTLDKLTDDPNGKRIALHPKRPANK